MGPISEPTLEQSRRSGGPHNLGTPQAYGSFHLRIFVESNPLPSPPLRRLPTEQKRKKPHSIISFPSEFRRRKHNKIEGFLFTNTKKQKKTTKLIRFPRFSLLVAVEFNQLGYSSLNFQRWKRIAAMQG
ncbi:hypothetical protein AAC387_Pa06g0355 [Persea americana]